MDQVKKITDRFLIINKKSTPKNYDAFLYRIDINETEDSETRHYIGWHAGKVDAVETQRYMHSGTDKDLKKAISTGHKIVYNILDYGDKWEIATKEAAMLSSVNAANNPKYYNKSNGGGKYCVLPNNNGVAYTMYLNVQDGKYPITFYDREKIIEIKNNPKNIQVRNRKQDPAHIKILKDKMLGKTADDFDPIVVLMPKSKDDSLPILIGGKHTVFAMSSTKTMNGLRVVEVPFKEWALLDETDLYAFGLMLNPQQEKVSLPNSIEDAAKWVLSAIKEKKLYKNQLPLSSPEPWFDHNYISTNLDNMGFCPTQKGEITKRAKEFWALDVLAKIGVNFLDFKEENLEQDDRLRNWYENKVKSIQDLNNVEKVIKISAGQHIWSQIEKNTFEYDKNGDVTHRCKSVHVLIYWPSILHKNTLAWKKSLNTFLETYNGGISNIMKIQIEFLPLQSDEINY
jgi:hypothetical protein